MNSPRNDTEKLIGVLVNEWVGTFLILAFVIIATREKYLFILEMYSSFYLIKHLLHLCCNKNSSVKNTTFDFHTQGDLQDQQVTSLTTCMSSYVQLPAPECLWSECSHVQVMVGDQQTACRCFCTASPTPHPTPGPTNLNPILTTTWKPSLSPLNVLWSSEDLHFPKMPSQCQQKVDLVFSM